MGTTFCLMSAPKRMASETSFRGRLFCRRWRSKANSASSSLIPHSRR